MDFEFARPSAALILLGIAALVLVAAWRQRARVRAWTRFADSGLWARIARGTSAWRPFLRAMAVAAALAATVVALMDPRWGLRVEEVPRSGLDCYFLVDVSRSMLAEDATPNRLERAKQFVADALDRAAGDRVGLIEFAGIPSIRVPLTLNYGAFRSVLRELAPQSAGRGGTELAGAIEMAMASFPKETASPRVIVILSDGEDMGEDPVAVAEQAREEGITIFTVGLGDVAEGGRIPVDRAGQRAWLVHDGQEVWSRMNPDLLARVADAGGGSFLRLGTAQTDFGQVYEQTVGRLERSELESGVVQRRTARYAWFAGLALALLLSESLVGDRRGAATSRRTGGAA
ncbi:MAG: VWA domain-containing protein [Phycisphaerae bacterium]|nr:VWA domain-containing protein [Phycisphaerae bacterium]